MVRSLKLFTIAGIEISVHYTWLFIFILIVYTLAVGYFPMRVRGLDKSLYLMMSVLSAFLLFASVLFHELSHSLMAKKEKLKVDKIVLFLFGGVAQISEEPKSAKDEFKIAVVGPISSFFLALVFWFLWYFVISSSGSEVFGAIFEYLALINFMLGAFNLLPGFPLDGGRILRAYFWNKTKDLAKATSIASTAGKGLGMFLILLGAFQVITGYFIGGLWMIFIGLFLRQAAESSYQRVLIMDVLSGMKVKELMSSNVVCVSPDLPISDLVDEFFFKHRFSSFPVCQKDKFLGIVTLHSVKEIPKERWREKTVSSAVKEVSEEFILDPEDDAVNALKKIIQSDLGSLPVLKDKKVVGILTRKDIMNLLRIKTDLGRKR